MFPSAMDDLDSLLSSIGERADELRSALATFDHRNLRSWHATLAHFQQLSSQLELLSERGSDAQLSHMLALPTKITPEPQAIPSLLSTRLDKEHEQEMERHGEESLAALVGTGAPGPSKEQVQEHNELLRKACDHFRLAAATSDLPKLPAAGKPRGAGKLALSAGPTEGGAAAGRATRVATESAARLLAVLRSGEGLRQPPPASPSSAVPLRPGPAPADEPPLKRPRGSAGSATLS